MNDYISQLNKLSEAGFDIPYMSEIRHMASTLNSWEAESRYKDSFVATKEEIDEALEIAEELLKYCNQLVEEV